MTLSVKALQKLPRWARVGGVVSVGALLVLGLLGLRQGYRRLTALELPGGLTFQEEDEANSWGDKLRAKWRAWTGGEGSSVSRFYTLEDLSVSATASRLGLDNTPPAGTVTTNLASLCTFVLDPLTDAIQRLNPKRRVQINSAYRAPAVNTAVGGSSTSDHPKGRAADIEVDGLTNRELAAWILELGLPFDQLIWYEHKSHVHIGYRSGSNRGDVYLARRDGTYDRADPRG